MKGFDPDPKEIDRRRRLTEARLSRLLRKAGADISVEVIETLIFGYHHTRFKTYRARLLALFSTLENFIDKDVLLPIVEDAWNYFPHDSLNGRSPADLIADQMRSTCDGSK
jgi:hypothetical protein